jgi:integrase
LSPKAKLTLTKIVSPPLNVNMLSLPSLWASRTDQYRKMTGTCHILNFIDIRPIRLEAQASIAKTKRFLENKGDQPGTCNQVEKILTRIARETDIFSPDEVNHYIAHAKVTDRKTGQPTNKDLSDPYKNRIVEAYNNFCESEGIAYTKPRYKRRSPIPLIPKTEDVQAIITNSSKRIAPIFQIVAETAIEGYELSLIPKQQINSEQGTLSVVGVKGHDNGTYRLKQPTAQMLREYLAKHPQEKPFPTVKSIREAWMHARASTAKKLCKPSIAQIPLRNLRNYAGAVFFLTMGKDPIQTMHFMRHKHLETTMDYLRGLTEFGANQEYISKIATTAEEAIELLNQGFKEEAIFGEKHLYRKLK